MKRTDFIKQGLLAGMSFGLLNKAFAKNGTGCVPTPEETEGPFPTHHPDGLVSKNIAKGKPGVALAIHISVFNINNQCMGLPGALVDIWHCDNKGEYSEYGGKGEHGFMRRPGGNGMMPPPPLSDSMRNALHDHRPPPPGMDTTGRGHQGDGHRPPPGFGGSMQATDYTKQHFLRGRQATNAQGEVVFTSVFPGWYTGRAPHIHVHVHRADGTSLLVTQIALPEQICKLVFTHGVYAAHGLPDTTNAADMVFSDSIASEMANVSGSLKEGFVLHHSIYVEG